MASGAERALPPNVIRLVSLTTSSDTTDRPPAGPSAGDSETSTSRLSNAVAQFGKPKGAVVGKDSGTARYGRAGATLNLLTRLPGGTLRVRGAIVLLNNAFVAPVVGGTGAFAGARGTLRVTGTGEPKRALNIYVLEYPAGTAS